MDKTAAAAIVKSRGWLSRCPADFQEDLLRRCQLRALPIGAAVYNARDEPGGIFGIAAGALQVRVPPGEAMVTVFTPGNWLGAATALRRASRWISARVLAAATILHLPQREFEDLIRDAAYCRLVAISVAEDLGEAVSVIGNLTHPDSEIRVAQRLLTFTGLYGLDRRDSLAVSQADLATMCGLSRQTLTKVLGGLIERGIVRAAYRRIEIIDHAALRALASNDDRVFR